MKGNKWKSYTGHSRATAYWRKWIQTDHAAQGYFPVHEFMRRIQLQKSEKDVTPSFEKESSDDDVITCIDELKASKGMNVELTPAVREDHHQAAHSPAVSEGNHQFVQDPVEHCQVWALWKKEEESAGSEGEDKGITHEDRKDVASRNGAYLLHFFSARLDGICLQNCLASWAKKVRTQHACFSRIFGAGF